MDEPKDVRPEWSPQNGPHLSPPNQVGGPIESEGFSSRFAANMIGMVFLVWGIIGAAIAASAKQDGSLVGYVIGIVFAVCGLVGASLLFAKAARTPQKTE